MTLRASLGLWFSHLELVSETLETFIITGSKYAYVKSYRCPKLKNLLFEGLGNFHMESRNGIFEALQAGVHSMDLTTMPADRIHDWFQTGFQDGVFNNSDFHPIWSISRAASALII